MPSVYAGFVSNKVDIFNFVCDIIYTLQTIYDYQNYILGVLRNGENVQWKIWKT
jgi:hypothetical protein